METIDSVLGNRLKEHDYGKEIAKNYEGYLLLRK